MVLTQPSDEAYQLVRVSGGAPSVHSVRDAETFHPGIGPAAEAEALYVRQLRIRERFLQSRNPFVVWDVGLGAAANAVVTIRSIAAAVAGQRIEKVLRLISFDRTTDAARFALNHARELGYLQDFESPLGELISNHRATVQFDGGTVDWTLELGDFPSFLKNRALAIRAAGESPDVILFDPHSPAKNPEMWTVELFSSLFRALDSERSSVLATFTRSTRARAAMLSGGFFVGAGHASGMKEETTVASNRLAELDHPLDRKWLERARRSSNAEPLREGQHQQAPLSSQTLELVARHQQFRE